MRNVFINLQCGTYVDGYIWGFSTYDNELYKINVENGTVSYVTTFKNMPERERLFNWMVSYNGRIILIPGNSPYIVTYRILDGQIQYYDYPEKDTEYILYQSFWKYVNVELYEDKLYLFSQKKNYMICIHMDNMEISCCSDYLESYKVRYGKNDIQFANSECRIGEWVYLTCSSQNIVLKFNLKTLEHEWLDINLKEEKGFKYIANHKEKIYLLSNNDKVYQWDGASNEAFELVNYEGLCGFLAPYEIGVLLVPQDRNVFINYNEQYGEKRCCYSQEFRFNPTHLEQTVTHVAGIKNGENYYITPRCSNMLLGFDYASEKLFEIKLKADEATEKYLCKKIKYGKELREDGVYTLNHLFRCIGIEPR